MKKLYLIRTLALTFVAAYSAGVAKADDRYFSYTPPWPLLNPGNWSEPSHWLGSAVPAPGDIAHVDNGSGVALDMSYATSAPLGGLRLDWGSTLMHGGPETLASYNAVIGEYNAGSYIQGNGIHTVMNDGGYDPYNLYGPGNLVLGLFDGSEGGYSLWDTGELRVGLWEYVGFWGRGVFNQFGGTHTVRDDLNIGYAPGSTGTFNLCGGTLAAGFEYVGGDQGGTGYFNQNGGVNTAQQQLVIGAANSGAFGTYTLDSGELYTGELLVGHAATGIFAQNGGSVTVSESSSGVLTSGNLILGNADNGKGTYTINGGSLATQRIILGHFGTGAIDLQGGTVSTGNLFVGNYNTGTFTQSGGNASVGVNIDETVQEGLHELIIGRFGGSTGTYDQAGGVLHVKREIVGDAGSTGTFNQSGDSRHTVYEDLIVGQDTGTTGTFNLGGTAQLHVRGNLILGDEAGRGFFNQSDASSLTVDNALLIGASTETGSSANSLGWFFLNGGTLSAGMVVVGRENPSDSSFIQTGGEHRTGSLTIGAEASAAGYYGLNDGALIVGSEIIGRAGGGVLNQFAGTNTVADGLSLGQDVGSYGSYILQGGKLDVLASEVKVGVAGKGVFSQYGGEFTYAGALYLGDQPTGEGIYDLLDGTLRGRELSIGEWAGRGLFDHRGGTVKVDELTLGRQTMSNGTYNLHAGTLKVGYVDPDGNVVGGRAVVGSVGDGAFTQIGGTATIVTDLVLGAEDFSSGRFMLSGDSSVLDVWHHTVVGAKGSGLFRQTGGLHTLTGMTVGQEAGALGTYVMSGGTLSFHWFDEFSPLTVGDAATGIKGSREGGIFLQSGGAVSTDLLIANKTGSTGRYEISGGELHTGYTYAGFDGVASFVQTGGEHSIFQFFIMGYGAGSRGEYNLSGSGLFRTACAFDGYERIGRAGTGIFSQSGGSHQVGTTAGSGVLELGSRASGHGEYNLSAGDLLVRGDVRVGGNTYAAPTAPGVGVFNQTGGASVIEGSLFLSQENAGPGSSGTYNLEKGSLRVDGKVVIAEKGVFHQSGGTMDASKGTIVNNGLFQREGGTLDFGIFSGSGVFAGDMVNTGTVAPGNSPGILTVNGNYTQGATGTLSIEVAGYNPGEFDVLQVKVGAAYLGGTLDVNLLGDFDPAVGSVFKILYAEYGINDKFTFYNMPNFHGKHFVVDFSDPNWAALSVAPVPLPPGVVLFGSGLLGLLWTRRNRRSA